MKMASRRDVLAILSAGGLGSTTFCRAFAASWEEGTPVTRQAVEQALWIANAPRSQQQVDHLTEKITQLLEGENKLRIWPLEETTPMAAVFSPHFFADPPKIDRQKQKETIRCGIESSEQIPDWEDESAVASASLAQLGKGLRGGRWSSQQLTRRCLDRLAKYDPLLRCVVTSTERLAMEQAARADEELQRGIDRGPLHGIPWGAKDILSVPGYPTTWGAASYRQTVRSETATVVERMEEAGAVLVAKLSTGTLAWGDQWHEALTRNPWNLEEGSSGSSAGSAAAVAAGLVPVALGSETLGSIVSPAMRCATTGLRPTFGRVSRYGAMTLGWTLDKIGPFARHVEDCAVVLAAIAGADGRDPTVVDRPFASPVHLPVQGMKIGVDGGSESELSAIEILERAGAERVPLEFPPCEVLEELLVALDSESASMHDSLYRSVEEDKLLGKWGPTFHGAQWIKAVHYIRSLRARVPVIQQTEKAMREVDVLIGLSSLVRTNLTGHPSLVVAFGGGEQAQHPQPKTVVLSARFFAEDRLIAAGMQLQQAAPPTPNLPSLAP
jgi:Asp-tRNA(Asn)/Glu-tRNA(Gln) amidotransferase A subunit family amidase